MATLTLTAPAIAIECDSFGHPTEATVVEAMLDSLAGKAPLPMHRMDLPGSRAVDRLNLTGTSTEKLLLAVTPPQRFVDALNAQKPAI